MEDFTFLGPIMLFDTMLLFLGQLMEFNQHNIITGKPRKANDFYYHIVLSYCWESFESGSFESIQSARTG